jgi:hypothetical protein
MKNKKLHHAITSTTRQKRLAHSNTICVYEVLINTSTLQHNCHFAITLVNKVQITTRRVQAGWVRKVAPPARLERAAPDHGPLPQTLDPV